ncbi:MAG: SpaH/EbpB family LPXTG-anchored major pilin [Anaerovoracaceae bacterium]
MKQIKKITGVLLILALIFTMSATAFAANTNAHTITITNDREGHTYTAYQVFKGEISNGKLTNIEWGSGVNGNDLLTALIGLTDSPYASCSSAEDVADVLKAFDDNSTQLDKFAEVAGKHLTGTYASSTETASPYTINVTGDGYYLVKDSGTIADNDAATKYILKVVGDVTVAAKSEVPSIDKIIVNADDGTGKGTAQDVGSSVGFKLTSKVPAMDGYSSYAYIVNDTLSAGLTFNEDVAVTIGGTEYTDFTVAQNDQSFTITFNNFINQKTNAGKDIVITYTATLNENALNTDKETNTVYLQYSSDPYDSMSTQETPKITVYVYDFDIVVDKYADGNEETKLVGAEFVLYKTVEGAKKYYKLDNGTVTWVDNEADATVVTTDENGAARLQGIDSGTYYLHETKAPAGYNLLKTDVEITITATYKADGQIDSSSATSTADGQYQQVQKIENKSGTVLPSTGGIGTTIIYIAGAILVIAGGVLLVTRKRMNKDK